MSTTRDQYLRAHTARKLVMLALRTGPKTADEIRPALKPLGRYGSAAGLSLLLNNLVAQKVIVVTHSRVRPTGPLVDNYRLPTHVCRVCGCDQGNACVDDFGDPCYWADLDLCSACADGQKKGGAL